MPIGDHMDPTRQTVRIFGEHAESYARKYADVGRYIPSLDRYLGLIPQGGRVLELACGPGNVTRHLLDRRPDLQVLATDLAPEMLAVAARTVPEAEHELMDMRSVGALPHFYQGIVCAFGLPYMDQRTAARFIHDAASRLLPGGVLYLSTMEDDPSKSGWEGPSETQRVYMNYHRSQELEVALVSAGFSLLNEERVHYNMPNGGPVTDLLIVAQIA